MDDFIYNDILQNCGGRLSIEDSRILYQTALEIGARNILEIGAMDGCSSMVLGYVAKETDGHVQSIEPAPKQKWRWNIDRLGLEPYVTLIFGESPWVSPEKIHTPIDCLFIDGKHLTRWVIVDYHYWERFVRPGGRIAFHDWTGAKGAGEAVRRAVAIILEDDNLKEIARHEANKCGIIVFEKLR